LSWLPTRTPTASWWKLQLGDLLFRYPRVRVRGLEASTENDEQDRSETSGGPNHQNGIGWGLIDRHTAWGGTKRMGLLGAIAKAFGSETKPALGTALGRNDPCWCGSGNKYKRCHLDSDLRRIQSQKNTCCTTS